MSGISMEAFGPISVDYFNGRRVESIDLPDHGDDLAPMWAITFEGGGQVFNYSPTVEQPPEGIVNLALTMVVLGAKETIGGKPGTLLYFGNPSDPRQYVVLLDPLEYAISDPDITKGQVVYAQRSEANMPGGSEVVEEDDGEGS